MESAGETSTAAAMTRHEVAAPPATLPSSASAVASLLRRYVSVARVAPAPKTDTSDRPSNSDGDGVNAALPTAEDDAEAEARHRWPDADAIRATLGERAVDSREPPWSHALGRGVHYENALLQPRHLAEQERLKSFLRPFQHAQRVSALGISARYAVVASRDPPPADSGKAVIRPALLDEARARYGANATEEDVEFRGGDDEYEDGEFVLWSCPVTRSPSIDWRRFDAPLPEGARLRGGHVCGTEALVWFGNGASERVAIVKLPRGKTASVVLYVTDIGATKFVFNERYVVALCGSRMRVWNRSDYLSEKMTRIPLDAVAGRSRHLNAYDMWRYEHTCALTSVRLAGGRGDRVLCGDASGNVIAFHIGEQCAVVGQTRLHGLDDAPVTALAFGGSRVIGATTEVLACEDRQRQRPGRLVLKEKALSSVVSMATWGGALITHDAANLLLVRDVLTGRVANAFPNKDLVASLPRPVGAYQSLAVCGDQIALLYPNGALLLVDVD